MSSDCKGNPRPLVSRGSQRRVVLSPKQLSADADRGLRLSGPSGGLGVAISRLHSGIIAKHIQSETVAATIIRQPGTA